MRSGRSGIRHLASSALRIRPSLGNHCFLRLCHAPGELPDLRGQGGNGSFCQRQTPSNQDLCLLSRILGQAFELVRGGRCLSYLLVSCFYSGPDGCGLGREHMNLDGITAIGVDEMAWGRWHHYVTVVYQIDEGQKRLLWMGPKRTVRTLLGFFRWFGPSVRVG